MSEETDEKFLDVMQLFLAVFDKSSMDHSNRDIQSNSWDSIAQETGMTVDEAKICWARLVREYRAEKSKREGESRSGSGASSKREMFPFYDIMKDMLMTSHATGLKLSNYVPQNNATHQQQQQQQQSSFEERTGAYDYSRASGRSKRKEFELKRTLEQVNDTIAMGKKLVQLKTNIVKSGSMTRNDIVGRIVQNELLAMDVEKSKKKRFKFQTLLLGESEE